MYRIVSPVSRVLAVSDGSRSVAFYRDILGFTPSKSPRDAAADTFADLVNGPARLTLSLAPEAVDSTGDLRPRGAAVVFFEVSDVSAARDWVAARGGRSSGIERASWIKMRVFEIRDPDGHTLWFGQSFQPPDPPEDPAKQLTRALPEFPWSDVPAGVVHYRDVLGFRVNHAQDDIAVMYRDDVTLLLIRRGARGAGSCYVYVNDADRLHQELRERGAGVKGEPVSHPWGLRDFQVVDPEGNRITFGQPFE